MRHNTLARRLGQAALIGTTGVLLAACGGGGGGSDTTGGTGSMRVSLTDAPACGYDHVYVTVEKVRVHQSATADETQGGWSEVTLSPARRVDLLTLTNGLIEELGTTALPAGTYSQVRLVLASNGGATPLANAVQPTGGAIVPLSTPSGQQSGVKLQAHFTVEPNQLADLVLDFDACKSVVKAGNSGKYNLKPVVSVLPKLVTQVEGFVTTTLSLSSTTVSVQQDGAIVRSTVPDTTGRFVLPFLPDGTYDLVVASEGRATAVLTGVPVSLTAGRTVVSGTSTAIAPPASAMQELTGTVSATTAGSGTSTITTLIPDATVIASQSMGTGTAVTTVTVAGTPVDAELASYRLRLPTAAPVKAPYSATTAPVWTAQTASAGKYTLRATAPDRAELSRAIDLATSGGTVPLVYGAP